MPNRSEVSKGDLLRVFQQRMDKCTNEQFWAVATLSAFYAALLSHAGTLLPGIPKWLIAIALSGTSFYALFFVIHRHKGYYDYRRDVSELVKGCPDAPEFMKEVKSAWDLSHFTGLAFYSIWILGGYIATMYVLLR